MVAGMMVSSMTAGQITSRTGHYRKFPIIGSAMLIIGLALLSRVGADTALWETDLCMVIFGAGLGMNMQTLVLAMQTAVPPKDMGVSTAAATFFRQVGGTLGTAVFLSILFTSAGSNIKTEYAKAAVSPTFQAAARAHPGQLSQVSGNDLNDTAFLKHMDHTLAHPFLVGFSSAMDLVFLVGAGVLVIAFVLSLLLKEVPLRMQSGLQAQAAAAAMADDAADPSGATHEPETVAPTLRISAGGRSAA